MNVMQDGAKRELAEGSGAEKAWLHRPVPGLAFQALSQDNDSLRFASTRHHDPQCFVEIKVHLADWSLTQLASVPSIVP